MASAGQRWGCGRAQTRDVHKAHMDGVCADLIQLRLGTRTPEVVPLNVNMMSWSGLVLARSGSCMRCEGRSEVGESE